MLDDVDPAGGQPSASSTASCFFAAVTAGSSVVSCDCAARHLRFGLLEARAVRRLVGGRRPGFGGSKGALGLRERRLRRLERSLGRRRVELRDHLARAHLVADGDSPRSASRSYRSRPRPRSPRSRSRMHSHSTGRCHMRRSPSAAPPSSTWCRRGIRRPSRARRRSRSPPRAPALRRAALDGAGSRAPSQPRALTRSENAAQVEPRCRSPRTSLARANQARLNAG